MDIRGPVGIDLRIDQSLISWPGVDYPARNFYQQQAERQTDHH